MSCTAAEKEGAGRELLIHTTPHHCVFIPVKAKVELVATHQSHGFKKNVHSFAQCVSHQWKERFKTWLENWLNFAKVCLKLLIPDKPNSLLKMEKKNCDVYLFN